MTDIEKQKTREELQEELKQTKVEMQNLEINNHKIQYEEKEELLMKAKGIKIKGIVALILVFTLIGIFVTFILNIICGIQILSTDWKNDELNNSKTLWGILCFILLGSISSIVFGSKASNELSK